MSDVKVILPSGSSVSLPNPVHTEDAATGLPGSPAPGFSIDIGFTDGSGNLQSVSPTHPLPVTDAAAEASLASLDSKTVHVDTGAVVVASSALPAGASTSALQTTGNTALATINTTLGSPMQNAGGSVTANAGTNLNTSALSLEATQSAFKTANHTDLGAINTTLGTPFQAGGSIGNTSFIANAGTNLNTSALSLEATQSAFKTANHTDLTAINTTLGTPMQQTGGSVTANAGTNLNTSALNLEATQSAFKTANHTDLTAINTTLGTLMPATGGSVIALSTDGAVTDGSGTTSATPSTSTQIFAANATRKYLLIQNLSATDKIYINLGAAATTTNSIVLGPDVGEGGGSYVMESSFISNNTVNVLSAAASSPYMAKQG